MNIDKAKLEIEKIKSCGLSFNYEFDFNVINKYMFCIFEEGTTLKDIISKLKENEIIFFLVNDGQFSNGDYKDYKLSYDEKYDGSIYWKSDYYGDCVRIDSNMGSIKEWVNELQQNLIKSE